MKTKLLHLFVAFTLTLSVFGVALPAAMPTAVEASPIIINVPGDYATIQEAINAAFAGDTVQVAPATYNEDITLKDGVNLQGAGAGVSIIQGTGVAGFAVLAGSLSLPTVMDGFTIRASGGIGKGGININGSSPFVLSHCRVTGTGGTISVQGVKVSGCSPKIEHCTITGNGGNPGAGLQVANGSPTIVNCVISYNQHGIVGYTGGSPVIVNSTIRNNSGRGMVLDYDSTATIINCTIYGNGSTGIYDVNPPAPTITNCIIWNNPVNLSQCQATYSDIQGGGAGVGNISLDPLFVDAAAGDFHLQSGSPCIDSGNSTAVPAWLTKDFEGDPRIVDGNDDTIARVDMGADEFYQVSIQGLVDAANPGDTIIVGDGTYIENVKVNKPLTIQSVNGAALTTVQAFNPNDRVFEITADNVTITGFTVTGATVEGYVVGDTAGIYLGNGVKQGTIANNIVYNNWFGIWVQSSSNNTITNNTVNSNALDGISLAYSSNNNIITNNTVNSNGYSAVGFGYYGIALYFSSNNNIITGNTANSNAGAGIYLESSSNNTITNNTADFIRLFLSYNNIITGNTADSNGGGIVVQNSTNNTITNNTAGIYLSSYSSNNTITNNIANSNSYYGISLSNSDSNTISGNTASLNGQTGIYLGSSSNNTITNNTVNSNTTYWGIQLEDSGSNTISGNEVSLNGIGIELANSSNNTITNNTFSSNGYGITLGSSDNNTIYLNNFTNDTNLYTSNSINTWNSPTTIDYSYNGMAYQNYLGNYWSDYIGTDGNNDGIGDTAYTTTEVNNDNYPLIAGFENYGIGVSIQGLIDAASPGDTIIVGDGTYIENVKVNKPLTIQSANGAALTTVQAANPNDRVFEITADNVTITGFTVTGANAVDMSGIYLGNGVKQGTIANNIVWNNCYGIWMENSANNTITNNTVDSYLYYGIGVSFSSNNNITNNTFNSNGSIGIFVYSSSNNNITGNTVSSNLWHGIFLSHSSNNTINNNTVSSNGYGIWVANSSNNNIASNTVNSNTWDGISLSFSSNNTINNNTADSNTGNGIGVYSSSNNTINNNTSSSNTYGISVDSSSNNTIYLNNFTNNTNLWTDSINTWNSPTTIDYSYNGMAHTNYLGNYWSDYAGTDDDNDGIGDTAYTTTEVNNDNYPLIAGFENYEIGVSGLPRDWTFMVYMAADNNLDYQYSAYAADLNEMEVVGSTDNVSMVVLLDRFGSGNTNIYYVEKEEPATATITSTIVPGPFGSEVNMGDPITLVSFVEWTMAQYPANHYALVLWDHGSGWKTRAISEIPIKGVCWDNTNGDHITTVELGTALSQIQSHTGVTLDIVGFDACLMEMIEIAYEIKDYAKIMVGSEEAELVTGWPYDTILGYLTSTPDPGILFLANVIVNSYMAYYDAYGTGIDTMSAVDLSQLPPLATALNTLVESMVSSGEWENIVIARMLTEYMVWDTDYFDLYDFAAKVKTWVTDATVKTDAQAVMDAVTSSVVAEGHLGYHPNVHGISIYLPATGAVGATYYDLAFSLYNSWSWFLEQFLSSYVTPSPPAWTEILTDNVSDQFEGVGPDIVGVDSSLTDNITDNITIAFHVRMVGTIDFNNFMGLTALDTDQNPQTPSPETGGFEYYIFVGTQIPGGGGSAAMSKLGIDLSQLDMETMRGGEPWAMLLRFSATEIEYVGMLPLFTDTTSYWTLVPLSLLGADDGAMDVVQLVGTVTPSPQWTDSVPDMPLQNPFQPQPQPQPQPINFWELIKDPAGDGYPDIHCVAAFRQPDKVGIQIKGAFDANDLKAVTWLDTDQNPAFGDPINDIGADYKVTVYTAASLNATLASWNGTAWIDVAPVTVNTDNTSYFWFELPLSDLGGDQGNMDVVQTIGTLSVEVTDIAPDEGHGTIGEPQWIELFSDLTGDSTGIGPDLTGVDAYRDDKGIAFRVRAEGIDFANLWGETYLDIDSDNTTGLLVNDIGADYVARVSTGASVDGWLGSWNGTAWQQVGGFGVYTDGNYYWFWLDFGQQLGGDEGEMDIVQVIRPLDSVEWSDKAPDVGHGASPPRWVNNWWTLIKDAEGDGYPDIYWVDANREPDRVAFRVTGAFDFSDLKAVTWLDTDQDPETGMPINDIGADYTVKVYTSASLDGFLSSWNGTGWEIGPSVVIFPDTNSFWFAIPLSQLGNDQGNMDVVQTIGTLTVRTDIAPDEGHGTIGEPTWAELFSDPTGDLLEGTAPDLTGVDISRQEQQGINFRVRAEGMDFANLAGDTYIDIDSDNTTGHPGGGYYNDIGAEYKAVVRSTGSSMPPLGSVLMSWNGTAWQQVGGFNVFTDGNYYWFWLDFGQLGGDDGIMDMVQVIGPHSLTSEVWTDIAPNEGHGTIAPRTIEEAITDGIAWLASQQNPDGSWGTQWLVAKTGLAVLKLETHATSNATSPFDPGYFYSDNVSKGLDYLFANAYTTSITIQPAGNPDSDSDGIGVYFHSPDDTGHQIYETSIAMMALAASNNTTAIVNVPGSPVNGWTYAQVLQDTVDYIAWAQTDSGYGRGGWNYEPMDNNGDRSDQSNSGWVTLGLAYAESPSPFGFSLPIPGFVRSELDIWINHIQNPVDGDAEDGGSDYEGPGGGHGLWVNMLKTGNLLQQMAFVGDNVTTPRVQDAIDYLVRHWNDLNTDPGWHGKGSSYHTTYTVMKGLEAFNADNITSGEITINWFADFADALLWEQNPDGSWPQSNFDDGELILSTEWALLTLQKTTAPTRQAPDLVVEEAYAQWMDETHSQYTVYYRIRNKGNVSSPSANVTLLVDGIALATAEVEALPPGGVMTMLYPFPPLTWDGARHEITVHVDLDNVVTELNEDNNCLTFVWPPKDWTFMVYMCADNELDGSGWNDLNEMEMAGSTDNVSIVVLRDGNGNGDSKIFYVQHDEDWGNIASPVVNYLGEVNMGDPQTLVNFVKWTVANYPAEHYALILWDRVGDYYAAWRAEEVVDTRGVCIDNTSGGDYLTVPEIGSALGTILSQTGVSLDLVGFDTSLMAMAEVSHELAPYFYGSEDSVIVASQELEPTYGWNYQTSLQALTANSSQTPAQLASKIITDYVNYNYGSGVWPYATLSAVSPYQGAGLAGAISGFAQAMILSQEPELKAKIKAARDGAERFWFNAPYAPYVDLYDFAQRVKLAVSDSVVQNWAQVVMDVVSTQAVVAEGHGSLHPNAHGISVYYPSCLDFYAADYPGSYLAFTRDTQWDEFLNWILEPDLTLPPVPTLNSPSDGTWVAPAPILKWNPVFDASGVSYILQVTDVSDNATFSSPIVNISGLVTIAEGTAYYRVEPPLNPGTYCWRVRAVDGAGNPSGWSKKWSFKVFLQPEWSYIFQAAINRIVLFGQSVAIADLGVNTKAAEPDSDLEIATGSDECGVYNPELGTGVKGVWRVFDSQGNVEWAKDTQSDQARTVAIADLDGDGSLEIIGGTTSGETVEVMDKNGNFVWTFPSPPRPGNTMWLSSPAVADVNPSVSGLEVIIGNRPLHTLFCFDGDNSDGMNDGIDASTINWGTIGQGTKPWEGTEGIDWDILWIFTAQGEIISTPAVGDVDNDEQLEVVFGAGDGKIYSLNGATGTMEWIFPTGGNIDSSAGLADFDNDGDLEVVIGAGNNKVYFINNDGDGVIQPSEVTSFVTGGPVHSSPSIGDVDGNGKLEVVIGSNDNNVYCLAYSPATNSVTKKWQYTTGGAVYSSAALVNRITGDWEKYTQLLVARPEFNSVQDLFAGGRTAKIHLSPMFITSSNPYFQAVKAALDSYGGSYTFVVATPDVYTALQTGTIDAAFLPIIKHPSSSIQSYITDLGCKLLPWSSQAGAAVISTVPRAMPIALPANTYTGQTQVIPGYAIRHWLDVYIGSEDGTMYVLDGASGNRISSFPVGAPIRSSPGVADIDGDGVLEVIFADWTPIPETTAWRGGGQTPVRGTMAPTYGDILWCVEDINSNVAEYAIESPMFRNSAERTGLYYVVDTTRPTVFATSPPSGAPDVAIPTTIQVTFSEAMNTSSAESAFLTSPTLIGNFSWTDNVMTFTSTTPWSYNTMYTVTISTAAQDLAGNSLATAYIWSFTTSPKPASVEVNSGDTIIIGSGGSQSGIPLDIKGLPDLGASNGLGAFTFVYHWNPDIIHVTGVTPGNLPSPAYMLFPGTPNNDTGILGISAMNLSAPYVSGNITIAYLAITAVGSAGQSTSVNVTITSLGDKNGNPIPATLVNAPVVIVNLIAETSISQALDASGVAVVKVNIDRIKDPSTGLTAEISGGIGSYEAVVSAPAGGINFLTVNGGVPPFATTPIFNNVTGVFSVATVSPASQPNNTTVARVVPRLVGSCLTSYNITVAFNIIGAAGELGLNVPEEHANSITLRRGNAKVDGSVDIFDAMYIAQYTVFGRTLNELNPLNAASVKYDGAGGDKIDIFDAMFIAQYTVFGRDAYFNEK